jgi:integrase
VSRRVRIERNIYESTRADGRRVIEIGYRDSTGKQRWKVLGPVGIKQARAERDSLLGRRGKGELVKPSPRLRFAEAAAKWLEQLDVRPTTRSTYESDVRVHLLPRWGRRRLDAITVDDAARLVTELRRQGRAEWTISGVLKAGSLIFGFARRRLGWAGHNPIAGLDKSERPKTGQAARRRIYQDGELEQTLAAALEPWRTLFALAAVTGARLSELLALRWQDIDLADPDDATITTTAQVDRKGRRQPLKTNAAERTIELPRQLAAILLAHKAASPYKRPGAFVFCTRSGRPLGQRNVLRALRLAQTKAVDGKGRPAFPALQDGARARDAAPNFHGFRHSAASEAIAAGDSVEEVSWQLGHKNSQVTRTVYVQEIASAERRARRRGAMEKRYGAMLETPPGSAAGSARPQQTAADPAAGEGEVVDLERKRGKAQ